MYEAANIHTILQCREKGKDKTPLWFMYVTATVQLLMVSHTRGNNTHWGNEADVSSFCKHFAIKCLILQAVPFSCPHQSYFMVKHHEIVFLIEVLY